MGTYNPEYESHLLALGEKMFLAQMPPYPRRKLHRRPHLELATTAKPGPDDSFHSQQVTSWLYGLSCLEKLLVCSEENAWLCSILRQMFLLKTSVGEGLFTLLGSGQRLVESEDLDDHFAFRRVSMEHGLALRLADQLQTQRDIERSLCFCDSHFPLDTVTLTPSLVLDTEHFLEIMNKAAGGKAFSTPCRVVWDNTNKVWLWETPGWSSGVNQALGTWALAAIERHVWMKYWEAHQLDPRSPGESQPFAWDQKSQSFLSLRNSLAEYWTNLPSTKQIDAVNDLTAAFNSAKTTWEHNPRPRKYGFPAPSFASFSHSKHCSNLNGSLLGLYSCPAGTYYSALRAKMQCCQNVKCVEEILAAFQAKSRSEFFDFLIFSDLVRAGSIMDKVTRAIALRIKSAQEEKYAEDLILSESMELSKTTAKKQHSVSKKKTKSPKTHGNDLAAVPASPATVQKENPRPWISGIIIGLLESLPDVQDDTSFQLVENPRRKPKSTASTSLPKEKPKSKNKGKRHTKKSKKAISNSSSLSPNPAPISVKVVYNESQEPLLKSEIVASEFPPLTKVLHSQSSPRLTEELLLFEQRNWAIMEQKTYTRMRLLQSLREIVATVFPGADAQFFGSYSTGLALPTSDMDVAIGNTPFQLREEVQAAVMTLHNYLLFQRWTLTTTALRYAAVPLVKLTVSSAVFAPEEPGDIKVDLTFDAPQRYDTEHIGMASSEFVRRWLTHHPQARSVALILKTMLVTNDLNSAYTGGISSYALLIWIAAYLHSNPVTDSGALLLGFLKFYGTSFNPKCTGIDLLKADQTAAPVETMDPVCPNLNVTKSSRRCEAVQELFALAHKLLSDLLAQGKKSDLLQGLLDLRLAKSI